MAQCAVGADANGTPWGIEPLTAIVCPSAASQRLSAPTRPSSAASATTSPTEAPTTTADPDTDDAETRPAANPANGPLTRG